MFLDFDMIANSFYFNTVTGDQCNDLSVSTCVGQVDMCYVAQNNTDASAGAAAALIGLDDAAVSSLRG
jgi:hypothetical protein